ACCWRPQRGSQAAVESGSASLPRYAGHISARRQADPMTQTEAWAFLRRYWRLVAAAGYSGYLEFGRGVTTLDLSSTPITAGFIPGTALEECDPAWIRMAVATYSPTRDVVALVIASDNSRTFAHYITGPPDELFPIVAYHKHPIIPIPDGMEPKE